MPLRRKPPPPSTATSASKPPTRSALAKLHNLTADQETAISEAFHLFSYPSSSTLKATSSSSKTKKGEGEVQLLPPSSVRRALVALNAPPASAAELREILSILVDDPADERGEGEEEGIPYERFIAVAALKVQQHSDRKASGKAAASAPASASRKEKGAHRSRRGGGDDDDFDDMGVDDDDEEEDEEVHTAFRLFTQGDEGRDISLTDLRRIARELREEVPEEVLRDMVREAKGGGDGKGTVGFAEFRGVMGRAGVW